MDYLLPDWWGNKPLLRRQKHMAVPAYSELTEKI
jgi:hypothetical protein